MASRYITGAQFRQGRERLDLSQAEAAELLNVDERTIQRWESGETKRVRRSYLEALLAKKRGA